MKMTAKTAKIVSAVAVALFLVTANFVGMVETKVTVEIKFRRFTNPGGRDEGGSYCEGVSSSCETYFKLCVKLSGGITTSFLGCDYQPASSRYIKSNNISFQTQNTNINKTILLKRNQWNGNVSFYMEVWDDDMISDDKIDTFRYTQFYSPGVNGSGLEYFHTIYGTRSSYKTTLYFSIKVFCDLHYYGSNCSRFCKSKDDMSGHYRCSFTGERVCYQNWQNWYNLPNCSKHCAPHNDDLNGHYVCASNGSRVCQQNWYNLPYCKAYCMPQNDTVNGHYECSSTGMKVCHYGWHGENCTIFCLPRIMEHYNCSATGARICHKFWYGPNCTRFCNSSSNARKGFYNCSSTGFKFCKADYFGENCTIFCKEIQNGTKQYFCDKRTGDKVCLEKWTGPFCNISRIISLSTEITQRLTPRLYLTSGFLATATMSSEELLPVASSLNFERIISTVDSWTQSGRTRHVTTPSSAAVFSRPLRNTNALSAQQSASFTSVHNRVHQASIPGSFQATSSAAQSSKIELEVPTTVSTTSTTITSNLAPSKSSPAYYKLHSTPTLGMTTPKSKVVPEKDNSGNKLKNVTWLVDTKEGRTVIVGAIFAFLLLVGVITLIVIYLRLPKRDSNRDFGNFNDTPDEWKTDEQLARSYINPLYVSPDGSCQSHPKKKQSKLEKFYTKKDPSKEPENSEDLIGVPDTSCDVYDDNTGIYDNPLFGIKDQSYDAAKEETSV